MAADGRVRKQVDIIQRRDQVARLYLERHSQTEIAEQLHVTQQTISLDLKALRAQWLESALYNFDEAKARELARIDHLERTYWEAWRRSLESTENTATERTVSGPIDRTKVSVRTEERLGDPRFLAGVQWCIERRCQILGLNAPNQVEHSGAAIIGIFTWEQAVAQAVQDDDSHE